MDNSIEVQNLPLRDKDVLDSGSLRDGPASEAQNDSLDLRSVRRAQSNNEVKLNSVMRKYDSTNRSLDLSEGRERNDISLSVRLMVFLSFLTSSFFFNLDNGVFPPTLIQIEKDLDLNEKHVALLNGVTFMVCGTMTIFVAPIMARFQAKTVLTFSALCNSIGIFLFIGTKNY